MTAFKRHKSQNWVDTDDAFGDFSPLQDNYNSKRKKINETTIKSALKRRSVSSSEPLTTAHPTRDVPLRDDLWSRRHKPTSISDLAVNSKKVDEINHWLEKTKGGGILLLTGPAGSGKTASLKILTEILNIEVQEWVNPVEQVNFEDSSGGFAQSKEDRWIPGDTIGYKGKAGQFKDWLRAAKYSDLSSIQNTTKRLILLEDFPASAYSRNEEFLSTLENFVGARSRVSLVLIVSESSSSKSKKGGVRELLPPDWMERMKVITINFNAVTTTNLVKVLSRIAQFESQKGVRKFRVPEKATLDNLAESVGGDIRAAINALQFSCLNQMADLRGAFESVSKLTSSKAAKGPTNKKQNGAIVSSLSRIGGKDQSLLMFHALGKVLYAKRLDAPEIYLLPPILRKHQRLQLQCNPEEVLDKCSMSPDSFTCFLHHNLPPFHTKISDLERISSDLSLADMFLKEWGTTGKIDLAEYGGSIAARSILFNTSKPQNLGRKTLTKPEYYQAVRTEKNRRYSLSCTFQTQPCKDLVTCSIPLLAKIRPDISSSKMATVVELASFPISKMSFSKFSTKVIDQNEMFSDSEGDDDDELLKACQKEEDIVEPTLDEQEEEFNIEDFDD